MTGDNDEINPLIDGRSYVEAAVEYESRGDIKLSGSDTIILVGDGAKVHVRNRALVLQHGRTHIPQEEKIITLYAGTHQIRRLVILSETGYVTLEAINWCQNQNINILMLDRDGHAILSSGEFGCDVALRRLQYQADDTGISGYIARELVRRKTIGQIDTLKVIAEYKYKRTFKKYRAGRVWDKPAWEVLESEMSQLPNMRSIGSILMLEARLAMIYWDAFIGIPIRWRPKDEKIVPPHWKSITERGSSLSGGTRARHAISPFHAVLNYSYGILEAQVLSAINASGLDPAVGCLHEDRVGRNSLVFDFMEPHRPQVDCMVLSLFEKTEFTRGMLVPLESGEVRLSKQFARYIVANCMLPLVMINDTVSIFVRIYRGI